MFALPIYRMYTPNPTPCIIFSCCQGIGCPPPKLKSGIRVIPEMRFNHYSLMVSYDYQYIAAWGGCFTYGTTGVAYNTNKPTTATIKWKNAIPQVIQKIISCGSTGGENKVPFTIFKTESNDLYGTGTNNNFILNTTLNSLTSYELIAENVIDFCPANDTHMLYIRSNGNVYGLGKANIGFGIGASPTDLKIDNNSNSNYLNITNAKKVFCTSPNSQPKSFVLLNDGTVEACGYNTDGCLGVNSTNSTIPTWTKVKKSDDNGLTFSNLTDVVDIITSNYVLRGGANAAAGVWTGGAGNGHMTSYFLTSTGYVYTCGSNRFGQLGIGDNSVNLTKIYAVSAKNITDASKFCATAGGTSILVTASARGNKVYTWGNNQWGQLGRGNTVNGNEPIEVPELANIKFLNIHGGGLNGVINGAFVLVSSEGEVYGSGYNKTFALGITKNGVPDGGPITIFSKNEYFGPNPTQNQDPERYPLILSGDINAGSTSIVNATMVQNKTVLGSQEAVYVLEGMKITGDGITIGTTVTGRDFNNFIIEMDKPATKNKVQATFTFQNIISAQNADLCGYGTEMAQKIVTNEGTLFMSGWNQSLGNMGPEANPCFNFNFYVNKENVSVPTYFDAKKFK